MSQITEVIAIADLFTIILAKSLRFQSFPDVGGSLGFLQENLHVLDESEIFGELSRLRNRRDGAALRARQRA